MNDAITVKVRPATPLDFEIDYPEEDGQPMGETGYHIKAIIYLVVALEHVFRHTDQVYVGADLMFYYEAGNPKAVKVPDVFVVKGIPKYPERRSFKLWEEGQVPCTIIEMTSKSTRYEDETQKKTLYQRLGVKEYFLFDPLSEYLFPRFQGYTLVNRRYEPIPWLPGSSALPSQELGLILQPEGSYLWPLDPVTHQVVPTSMEAAQLAQEQAQRATLEAQRADSEAQRATLEAQRADTAEAELAKLRAKLKGKSSQ